MTIKPTALSLALLTLASCASYPQPNTSEPHATLVFDRSAGRGGNIISQGRLLTFFIAEDAQCSKRTKVAYFGTGDFRSDQRTVRVPSDVPVTVLAAFRINHASGIGVNAVRTGEEDYSSQARFIPKEGAIYKVALNQNYPGDYNINVRTDGSDEVPSDLEVGKSICR